MNDWIQEKVLHEDELSIYKDDELTQAQFNEEFKGLNKIQNICWGIFVLCFIPFVFIDAKNIAAGIFVLAIAFTSFIVLAITGTKEFLAKKKKPAVCSQCKITMSRYEYTDGNKNNDINGTVYICHACNRKFIDSKPTFSTA